MLYYFLYPLSSEYFAFNVFRYITFRALGAALTAFIIAFLMGPYVIKKLKIMKFGENVSTDGPKSHQAKQGTPTMGGMLVLMAVIISTLLWVHLSNLYVWIMLGFLITFGLIGFWDDYKKLKSKKGLSGKKRLIMEFAIAFIAGYVIYEFANFLPVIRIPFFKDVAMNIGWLYIPFIAFIIVGTTNAVNLTDGLDGLAIVPVMVAVFTFGIFAYVSGHAVISNYLQIQFIPGAGELAIICAAITSAGMGFLWYNTYPAQVFMGNTGSVPLGAAVGTLAVITKNELLLMIVGGIFLIEAMSVILQVASFKSRGKRIFKMAPLHHHFELSGIQEPKIIVRFWIVSIILALIALSTLKLR